MSDQQSASAEISPRRIPWVPLGLVAVVLAFALFGDRGFLHLFKLKNQQDDLQQQLAQVEAVNTELRQEIASLSSDRNHLERLARAQLGMVREDEVVYQFAHKSSPAPPAAASTPPAR